MTDLICPLCGKPNPADLDECQYCQAPLKTGGFLSPAESDQGSGEKAPSTGKESELGGLIQPTGVSSNLEEDIHEWLKETEASFLSHSTDEHEEPPPDQTPLKPSEPQKPAIDDEWLSSLLKEASESAKITPQEETPQVPQEEQPEKRPPEKLEGKGAEEEGLAAEEQPMPPPSPEKPDWLTSLEAATKLKLEGGMPPSEPGQMEPIPAEKEQELPTPPEWLTQAGSEAAAPADKEPEPSITPAELPVWLEALRPPDVVSPTAPVEDVSGSEVVTAGPLSGLRGVISAHPSAIKARKPPTYSIKLKVTEEQQARVEMLQELLADEEKPAPLPSKPIITSRNIFRLIVVVVLLLPIVWMIVSGSQHASTPQPGNIPGVIDFTQQIQRLPSGATVLMAFDYEAGFSGEMNIAITNLVTQLINKNAYLTIVATSPSGPPLAESIISEVYSGMTGKSGTYANVADLGYIPGGTMGLVGLATSPKSLLPYSLSGYNVWAGAPLNAVSGVQDFNAIIVLTNDADTARIWIEQIGPHLQQANKPLLFITSSQAEPLIRPYYESSPSQVQGMISGLTGGVAYARTLGNLQQNGVWDAYSIGITVSILIILVGSIAGWILKMIATEKKKEED